MSWRPALVGVLVLIAQPAASQDYAEVHTRAAEAFRADDLPAFRQAVLDALALRPDYPPMLFNLAVAEARLGHGGEAMALLARLDGMGLAMPVDAAAFPSLAGDPAFEALAADFAENGRPRGEAREVARLAGESGFLPEGVAVDPATGDVFVGSVRQARIVRIDAKTGEAAPFAGGDPDRLWGVFGMRVSAGRLWVATSAVEETLGLAESARGRAAVLVYDVNDATLLFRCVGTRPAVFGDLLPADGGAWVSDSTGGVLHLDPESCAWETRVPPGRFVSPQGLADGGPGRLLVADYRGGLFSVGTADGQVRRLTPPDGAAPGTLYGIDGLDRAGDWLLAVQNGLRPHRVVALKLSPGGERIVEWRELARALGDFDEPTLGVVHGGEFLFVANSGWERYAGDGGELGGPPLVLAVPVPGDD